MASIEPPAPVTPRPPVRRRARSAGLAALVVVLVAAAWHFRTDLRLPGRAAPASGRAAGQVATAAVVSGPLTDQQLVSGSVQYLAGDPYAAGASSSPVAAPAPGTLTGLPTPGQVVAQGQTLYRLDGLPVLLLYGPVPAYRTLAPGLGGADVAELDADLVALGYASSAQLPPGSRTFTDGTARALERLQSAAGLPSTGQLPLGEAVFLPAAVRIAGVGASLGAAVSAGQAVLQTTSSQEEVVAQVDPSVAAQLKVGDPSTITFADHSTAPARIAYIAPVATSGSGSGSPPTVVVDIAPAQASAVSELDNASVQVSIITASVPSALAVPVNALLAQGSGGYALQVLGAGGAVRTVAVQLGIFDDAAGLVQVSAPGLAAGQRVVVAGQ